MTAGTAAAQTPQTMEDELLAHFKVLNEASSYTGSGDDEVQTRENKAIYNKLRKYGKRSDVLAFSFSRLSEEMTIRTSKDGNFRSYSWDCECGGTMHDYYSVFQYRSGKSVKVYAEPFATDISERGVGAFVHDIFQMPVKGGTVYMPISTFIGSTSHNGQFIEVWLLKNGKLYTEPKLIQTKKGLTDSIFFEYNFFSVVNRPERPIKLVFFDEKSGSFKFPVVIEEEKTPYGRVTDKFITYTFNGKYFVKTN